jgi:adenylate cyclase
MKDEQPASPQADPSATEALAVLSAHLSLVNDPAASAALEALRSHMSIERIGKSERLAHAGHIVNASLDLEAVLRNALQLAVDVMKAERGFIVIADGLRIVALHNIDGTAIGQEADDPSRAIVQRTIDLGEIVYTTDAQTDPRWNLRGALRPLQLRSIVCVPLRVRDKVLGAVYLDSRVVPGLFEPGDREMLMSFAYQAALAIENARIFEEERDRLQRISALQAFQTRILEAIANGVITLSPRREITTFNRSAERTFGIASDKMNGKAAFALAAVMPEFPELLDTFFSSGGVALRAETEGQHFDGRELTLELQLSPLESPEGKGVAIVVSDVTKHRRLEQAHEAQVVRAGRVQESFTRYLAPHVVKSLMEDPVSIRLGGERTRATMFFADVRGFTQIAATLPPERVVEILNTYFEEAVRVVFENDGLLDKFYGDGLMAVFGPPRVRSDDASRAIAAAIALHGEVAKLGPRLDHPLKISVGIATGYVVAGHFGSAKRMDYTVIGDAVNLASGLQSAAPPGTIYCDDETLKAAGTIPCAMHDLAIRVKGRAELVSAHALFPFGTYGGMPLDPPQIRR